MRHEQEASYCACPPGECHADFTDVGCRINAARIVPPATHQSNPTHSWHPDNQVVRVASGVSGARS